MPRNPPVPAFVCLVMSLTRLASAEWFEWSQLPPLPDAEGLASPFAGVSSGALLVGGGANIPENKWADVFSKVWHDRVFVWEPANGNWITGSKLPRALGYGVSITAEDSVLCFGGSDATQHYADSFRMKWSEERLEITHCPK
jgi:N-acetylneuraminic acid mutarotase